jgi:hypothetical protein
LQDIFAAAAAAAAAAGTAAAGVTAWPCTLSLQDAHHCA